MSKSEERAQEVFTLLMIDKINEITGNWKKPWISGNGNQGLPQNIDGRLYNGMNSLMLFLYAEKKKYKLPVFMTFNQARDVDLSILKGEKSFPIMYWNFIVKNKESKQTITFDDYKRLSKIEQDKYNVIPFQKYYNVFNVEQSNIKDIKPELFEALEAKFKKEVIYDIEGFFKSPVIDQMIEKKDWITPINHNDKERAFYSFAKDEIVMPYKSKFIDGESYYSTLLHEMTHSTGINSRLNREFGKVFGDEKYGREELVAELTAAILGKSLNLSSGIREENALYLKSWLSSIHESPRFLMSILSDVNKASAMISASLDYTLIQSKEISHVDALNVLKTSIRDNISQASIDPIIKGNDFEVIVYNATMNYIGKISAVYNNDAQNWALRSDTKDAFMIPINEIGFLDKKIHGANLTSNDIVLRSVEKKSLSLKTDIQLVSEKLSVDVLKKNGEKNTLDDNNIKLKR